MRLSLNLNRRIAVLTAALMPFLLWLGSWQLQRADEKRAIEAEFLARHARDPVPLGELNAGADLAFVPVSITGRFDNEHYFLLDNRMHRGQLGFEVLAPVLTERGRWALVNRGWIKANPDRRDLPAVPPVEDSVRTTGSVYVPPSPPFLLAEQDFAEAQWPLVVQAVEVEKFAEVLDRDLFPHVIRLDDGTPGALEIDWQPINVEPEKHIAYAVQWFAMAAALALWFVFANTNLWQVLRARGRP